MGQGGTVSLIKSLEQAWSLATHGRRKSFSIRCGKTQGEASGERRYSASVYPVARPLHTGDVASQLAAWLLSLARANWNGKN